jgi:hypothetical protein
MTITFENDNDVIVYALEKIISFARENQYLFAANCVWWLASVIGLKQGLVIHIDNLQEREYSAPLEERFGLVHPDRTQQILPERAVSSIPRDLTEDKCLDQVLEEKEKCLATSNHIQSTWQHNRINPLPQTKNQLKKARKVKRLQEANKKGESTWQHNRINPLPQTKNQLKKARKVKRLQEANKKGEAERNKRLQEIRATVIKNLRKE